MPGTCQARVDDGQPVSDDGDPFPVHVDDRVVIRTSVESTVPVPRLGPSLKDAQDWFAAAASPLVAVVPCIMRISTRLVGHGGTVIKRCRNTIRLGLRGATLLANEATDNRGCAIHERVHHIGLGRGCPAQRPPRSQGAFGRAAAPESQEQIEECANHRDRGCTAD